MANDCLVTKLNGVVEKELPYFASIRFYHPVETGERHSVNVVIGTSLKANRGTLHILKGHAYSDSAMTNEITTLSVDRDYSQFIFYIPSDEEVLFIVDNKYGALLDIGINRRNILINVNDLSCCYSFNELSFLNTSPTGVMSIEKYLEYVCLNTTRLYPVHFYVPGEFAYNVQFKNNTNWNLHYYCVFDNSRNVSVYGSRTGTEGNYNYSDLLATFNSTTKEWTYSV